MCDSLFRVVVLIFILQFIKISNAYEYNYYSVPGARPGQIEHERNNKEVPLSASPVLSSHFKSQNGQLNERISQNFGNGFGDLLMQAQQYPPVPAQMISYPNENQRDGAGEQQGHGGHIENHSSSGYGYGYGQGQTNHHHHEHETVKPYGEGVAMESKEILGGGAILKILLATFPFLITLLFPPMLLVVIGLLLIPVVRLQYLEEAEGRGFLGSSFGEELQSSIVGSISSSTNKYDSD